MSASVYPGFNSLVGLADDGLDLKPTLLCVLTDLYVQKASHTSEEERQFIELALRLIDAVDAETKAAAARRLSDYPEAPAEIVRRLTVDLSRSVAQKPHSETLPPETDSTMSGDAAIADRFFAASPEERVALLAELGASGLPDPAVTLTPTKDTVAVLEASALEGRPDELVRELERALGIARTLAEAIVNDRSGEPLVVAAKALAVPIDVLQRILLFVNPSIGHSVRRVYALTALFDEISLAAALRVVASWREAGEATAARRRLHAAPQGGRPALGSPTMPARHAQAAAHPHGQTGSPSANDAVQKVAS
ncbi:MAG: DUF2336 domain-containing protein [Rhodoplanes sp.]